MFVGKNKAQKDPLSSLRWQGFKLEDYLIGQPLGKGCNAAVYEAAIPSSPHHQESTESSALPVSEQEPADKCQQQAAFPLAIKMMWNISVRSQLLTSSLCVPSLEVPRVRLDGVQGSLMWWGAPSLHNVLELGDL